MLPGQPRSAPEICARHFPPAVRAPEVQAVLMIEPALIGLQDVKMPALKFAQLGDSLAAAVPSRTARASAVALATF